MAPTMRMDPGAGLEPEASLDETTTVQSPPGGHAPTATKKPRARRCPTCEQAFSGEARFCPFDGDALVDAPDWDPGADPLLGKIVDGRYEVAGVLGEGGMGTVYEVRHTTLGRRFALKVLRRDIADAEHTARFIQEAKAAAAIGHPNIVAVSDFGELAVGSGPMRVPYFVMEYLTGISLAALLRADHTLEPVRATDLFIQCAGGLAAAHAAGVIHRDLKPDNVFLTRTGDREYVKLLDFGVAKMAGAGRLTRAGMVFGTPHYMSPEQAAGQSVDHRADIYALGVIMYETLAGRVPFEADTYMGVLTKHMFATPEPLDRVAPDASGLGALGPIAMRCLAKSPADRYASMAELGAALEEALAHMGARPRSPGPLRSDRPHPATPAGESEPGVSKPPGLRPVVGPVGYAVAGLGLAGLVVLGALQLRGGPQAPAQPATASASATAKGAPEPAAAVSAAPPATAEPSATAASVAAPTVPASEAIPRPTATPAAPSVHPTVTRPTGHGVRKSGRVGGDVLDPWNK